MIGQLLLTFSIADFQEFMGKNKPVVYTGVFVEIYYQQNHGLVYETHKMIEVEKYPISKIENSWNFNAY